MWCWLARAELVARDGLQDGFSFQYRGVNALIQGFPGATKHKTYSSAVSSVLQRKRQPGRVLSVSSAIVEERKLALMSCGKDWEDSFEVASARFNQEEDYEAGAKHAFLSGRLSQSMTFLQNCKGRPNCAPSD